jgi:multidrug efflux pump subunit AcrA (membrane-fusion protein)
MTKQRQSEEIQKLLDRAKARVGAFETRIQVIRKPFDRRIEALREKAQQAAAKTQRSLFRAQKHQVVLEKTLQETIRAENLRDAQTLPETENAQREALATVPMILNPERKYGAGRLNAVRPPKCDGFTIFAGKDGDWPGAERFYIAYHTATKKLAGVLQVEPSKHPGDYTSAKGLAHGAKVFNNDGWHRIERPLEQWLDAMSDGGD